MNFSRTTMAACAIFALTATEPAFADNANSECKSLWPNKRIECLQEQISKNQSSIGSLWSRVKSLRNQVGSLQAEVTELENTISLLQSQVAVKADKTELSAKADKSELSAKADKSDLAAKADKTEVDIVASSGGSSIVGKQVRIKTGSGECLTVKDNALSLGACGADGANSFVLEQ